MFAYGFLISIGGLSLSGVMPGILIALSQMLAVYVFAKIYHYPILKRSSLKEFAIALFFAIPPLTTLIIIVGGIVGGFLTPTEAFAALMRPEIIHFPAIAFAAAMLAWHYRSASRAQVPYSGTHTNTQECARHLVGASFSLMSN